MVEKINMEYVEGFLVSLQNNRVYNIILKYCKYHNIYPQNFTRQKLQKISGIGPKNFIVAIQHYKNMDHAL